MSPQVMPDVTEGGRTPIANSGDIPRIVWQRGLRIRVKPTPITRWRGIKLHTGRAWLYKDTVAYVFQRVDDPDNYMERPLPQGKHIFTLIWRPAIRRLSIGLGPFLYHPNYDAAV